MNCAILSAAVINGAVAYEVNQGFPGAFEHYGAWYIWEHSKEYHFLINQATKDKYERLTAVLKCASLYAQIICDVEDGGTCNFDSPVLDYMDEHMQKSKAIKAIHAAGLRCFDWTCFHHPMLVITGFECGQANRRTEMAEAFHDYMKNAGYSVSMYYQAD